MSVADYEKPILGIKDETKTNGALILIDTAIHNTYRNISSNMCVETTVVVYKQ